MMRTRSLKKTSSFHDPNEKNSNLFFQFFFYFSEMFFFSEYNQPIEPSVGYRLVVRTFFKTFIVPFFQTEFLKVSFSFFSYIKELYFNSNFYQFKENFFARFLVANRFFFHLHWREHAKYEKN